MGIESNKEAYQTMKNSIGSMENRMREIYNKGYKDGVKEGINQAMQKIADSILEEVEVDRKTENSSEKPNNCEWSVEYAKEMLNTMPCEDCGHWEHGAYNHYYCALLEMRQECYFESKDESTLMFANKPKTEPQTDCGDFAGRLAYERGIKHAWEVAQKVFDSTVTFYEAEDVAKQIAKDEPSSSEKPNNCEPQYEMGMGTLKCDNCSEHGSFKCTKCDGEMYFKRLEIEDEPQTDCAWK